MFLFKPPLASICLLFTLFFATVVFAGSSTAAALNPTCPCDDTNPSTPVIITGTETWSDDCPVLISHVEIWDGGHLTITGKITMDYNRYIDVQRGGHLTVNDGTITSDPNNPGPFRRWKGIYVRGNPALPQAYNHHFGWVEVVNGSLIEHANNGIATTNPGGWGDYGGIVECDKSLFVNNGRSIEFLNYTETNISTVSGCSFRIDEDYQIFRRNFIGHITAWQVTGISITDCRFLFASSLHDSPYITTHPISANIFDGTDINISCSQYDDFETGIRIENDVSAIFNITDVQYCEFRNNNTAISLSNGELLTYGDDFLGNETGISIEGEVSFEIEQNYFSGQGATSYPVGVYVHNTSLLNGNNSFGREVHGNLFEKNEIAVHSIGTNGDDGGEEGMLVLSNIFDSSNSACLVISSDPNSMGTAAQGIAAIQGDGSAAAGNIFEATFNHIINVGDPIKYFFLLGAPQHNPTASSPSVARIGTNSPPDLPNYNPAVFNCDGKGRKKIEKTKTLSQITEITLAPNPTSNQFIIQLPGALALETTAELQVFLYDQLGRRFSPAVRLMGPSIEVSLDGMPNGTYLVQLMRNEEQIGVRRIVKQ